jgi:hypothetical protein
MHLMSDDLFNSLLPEDFFYDVDRKYQVEKTISAVDVDLVSCKL